MIHRLRAIPVLVFLAVLAVPAAGCGGDGGSDERRPPAAPAGTTVVAALGDSITAGSPLWDPDPALRAQIAAPDPRSQYGYWAELALAGTDFRNCGVPGERTDEIADRLDECAAGAEVLIVQGGVNDIAQGRAVAAAARDLRRMVRRGEQRGLRVAIAELLPWNGGYPQAHGPVRDLNRRIARIGSEEGVPVLQWYELLEDPKRPGRMALELTADLAHPSIAGYRRLGRAVKLP